MNYIQQREGNAYVHPMWGLVRGHNNTHLGNAKHYNGSVELLQYAGKKLSDKLWEDLIYRLNIQKIEVFRINQERKTVAWIGGRGVQITVNDSDEVQAIDMYL
jgi:hypothetical protein